MDKFEIDSYVENRLEAEEILSRLKTDYDMLSPIKQKEIDISLHFRRSYNLLVDLLRDLLDKLTPEQLNTIVLYELQSGKLIVHIHSARSILVSNKQRTIDVTASLSDLNYYDLTELLILLRYSFPELF